MRAEPSAAAPQHRSGDDVADGIDAGSSGGEAGVDRDAALSVELDAGRLQPQALGVGLAADTEENPVAGDRLASLGLDDTLLTVDPRRGDPDAEVELETLFLEDALGLPGDLAVDAEEDAVEVLENGDLRAQAGPHRAELEADHPGADQHQMPRHLGIAQGLGARADALTVELDAPQGPR